MKLPIWNQPRGDDLYEDDLFWHLPDEGYPHIFVDGKPLPHGRSRSGSGSQQSESIAINDFGKEDQAKTNI